MCYINLRLTYLLTYLLTYFQDQNCRVAESNLSSLLDGRLTLPAIEVSA